VHRAAIVALPMTPYDLSPSELKVLVLAGSETRSSRVEGDRDQSRELPLADKAFLPLRGRLVIEYVLDLLGECGLTNVWVLASERHLSLIPTRHRFTAVVQEPGAHFFANVSAGLDVLQLRPGEPALMAFGDHPLTSRSALQYFLARCRERLDEADFFHALALQASYREYAPWFTRTSVHMREMSGRASGFTLAVPSRLHRLNTMGQLYGVRKLERLGSLFGLLRFLLVSLGTAAPRSVIDGALVYLAKEMEKGGADDSARAAVARRLEAWLTARVSMRRLERYAARVLGAERGVRVVPVAHGGIAIDVDYAEEFESLEAHWDALQQISARQDAAIAEADRPVR
jgi:molybdopterin-guanine dinucleotide biosynthesis protein A